MVRASLLFPVLLTVILLSPAARAADSAANGGDEKGLTVVLDHAKLTAWVLEEFPDGLPFDTTGKPTDDEKAKQLWEIIAGWPVNVAGQATGLAAAIVQVCDAAGLPIYFTPGAAKALEAAGAKMRLLSISDGVRKAVVIIGRLAGVEKTVVMPFGLIVVGPDEDPGAIKELVAAPPQLIFLWRADYAKLVEKAFPDGLDREKASEEDLRKLVEIATSSRCDLVVPSETDLQEFLQWLAAASQQSFAVDQAVADLAGRPISTDPRFLGPPVRVDDEEKGIKIGPVECRFALFLDALNAALAPAGLEATAEETHFSIAVAKPKNTFRWREDWRDKVKVQVSGGMVGEGAPEEWIHVWDAILDTRCDFVVAEGMELREFLTWLASESQLNASVHPFTSYAGGLSLDEMHKLLKELPDDVDYGELAERDMAGPHPPTARHAASVARKMKPVALRDVTVREALNAVLADLDLMVMAGSIGQIRVVPKGLTKEELEQLRRQDVESWRSDTDSSHQEEESHD